MMELLALFALRIYMGLGTKDKDQGANVKDRSRTQPSEEAQVQTFLQQIAQPFDHPRLRGQPDLKRNGHPSKNKKAPCCLTLVICPKALPSSQAVFKLTLERGRKSTQNLA